jgi:hypothetical protein
VIHVRYCGHHLRAGQISAHPVADTVDVGEHVPLSDQHITVQRVFGATQRLTPEGVSAERPMPVNEPDLAVLTEGSPVV